MLLGEEQILPLLQFDIWLLPAVLVSAAATSSVIAAELKRLFTQ